MVLRNWGITNIFIFSSGWFSCREWIAFVQTGLQLFWHSKFKAKRLVGLQNRHSWSFDKKRQRHNFQKERKTISGIDVWESARNRSATKCKPQDYIRRDKVGRWPEIGATRQRCKNLSGSGKTVILCNKCNIHLCLKKHKNCFKLYRQ